MNSIVENQIKKFISKKYIKKREILSDAFNMRCEKFLLNDNSLFVAKYYISRNYGFNSIDSEARSLTYLSKKIPSLFPKIKFKSKNLIIIDFIKHNNAKDDNYQISLAKGILKLHTITNDTYGFKFDAQIGGLQQSNNFETSWINFFLNKRLNMIFEKINKENSMPKLINYKIEKLMRGLHNHIPKNPNISLLHGDLWEGNILFHNKKLIGFIDPGIYFGHHELEIAYLTWFKFVNHHFLNFYSNFLEIDKYFPKYEPIYQLYFSLLNIYLWNRKFYLKDTNYLLEKIFKHTD